jgi:DNA-binding CsgD family transcriptional regulator
VDSSQQVQALRTLSTLATDCTDPANFLSGLVLRVLQPLGTRVSSLARLNGDGSLQVLATYGSAGQPLTQAERISLWAETPVSDAVRDGLIIHRTWDEALERYPFLDGFDITGMDVLGVPVIARGSTIGGLGFLFDANPNPPDTTGFWEIVAAMCAQVMRLTTHEMRIAELATFGTGDGLSPRQLRILHLIAEGRTNAQIGEIMRFGTSTIGHHTMEIFRFFGVRTRAEAVAAAKERGLLQTSDPGGSELASEIVEC